jgi:hypothetical protein
MITARPRAACFITPLAEPGTGQCRLLKGLAMPAVAVRHPAVATYRLSGWMITKHFRFM